MPITIQKDSFFRNQYPIRYISGWGEEFNKYKGMLLFYPGNPKYVVDVQVLADKDKLEEEDIIIILGENHNATDIEKIIKDKVSLIYEMCKSKVEMEFVLALDRMKIITREDFTSSLPVGGINTFFIFDDKPQFFCLVNNTRNISDGDFYSWLLSYIYSKAICLTPRGKIEDFAKFFMQSLATLSATRGDRKSMHVSKNRTVLNCPLGDCAELLLEIPGNNTKRFEQLVEKSLEQIRNKKEKSKK